jgi:hypothetical protein
MDNFYYFTARLKFFIFPFDVIFSMAFYPFLSAKLQGVSKIGNVCWLTYEGSEKDIHSK